MSNFTIMDSAKASVAFDLSKFGPMTSINLGQPAALGVDPGKIAWTIENFPKEGVTIEGVTFKLADLSKFDFSKLQHFLSGNSILATSSGVPLQAANEVVWQVPTSEDGAVIEMDFAGISLAGIDLSGVTFHTFAF
ncbi:MAG: hypothetical protein ABW063_14930 [Caulobacter sp.]